MKNSIFACLNPVEKFWQLGQFPLADKNFVLIGWNTSPKPIDGGVPEAISKILAQAMTSIANVIFLSYNSSNDAMNEWKFFGDEAVCVLREPNLLKRFTAAFSGIKADIVLSATRQPETVKQLFDGGMWSMQAQVVFLSAHEQALPNIDRQTMFSLFQNDWLRYSSGLRDEGVECIMRPGVDGSVAGFLFLTAGFYSQFLKVLENESRAAGFDWNVLSEADFILSLAD